MYTRYVFYLMKEVEPCWAGDRLRSSGSITPAASTMSLISTQSPAIFPKHHAL